MLKHIRPTPLWISLHLPCLSLDVLFPQWSAKTLQAAVLHNERVSACTSAAQALGVRIGIRRNSALGLAPQLLLRNYDRELEQQSLQKIALTLLQYTPNLALISQNSLVLEVSASLLLFNGPRALWQRIHASLQPLAIHTRLGMAPTAQGAWILASQTQSRQRRTLKKRTLSRLLDHLPFNALPAAQAYEEWLEGIGCQTLEQLRKLPRQALQQRSSPTLMQAIDAAYGRTDDHFTWFKSSDFFSERIDAVQRLEHTHAVQAVAQKLIHQLCNWLQSSHYAVNTLDFLLHHEKGRHAQPPTRLTLALSQACWRPEDFSAVLQEQLHHLSLSAPVIAITLSVSATHDRPAISNGLFPEPALWAKEEHRLLDLLRARLGTENVLQAQPKADYRPERANLWAPAASGPGSFSSAGQANDPPHLGLDARPFWLFPTPLALNTLHNRPVYRGQALRLIQGPERIESGWWEPSGHELRDYFIAEDHQAVRYWIYRQRESSDLSWFLQGLFG
jgi:protein ImuB